MKNHRFLFYIIIIVVLLNQASAQTVKCPGPPKNIIILIGDGMGFNHIKAANYYYGTGQQEYEKFPVSLAMAHYPAKTGYDNAAKQGSNLHEPGYDTVKAWTDTAYLKRNCTESAAAATAISTGYKTYNSAIGMSVDHDTLVNLVEWAKDLGKSAGVVTSVQFSHATPAAFVAHNENRENYSEIAYEMLLDSRCDVIMGCGNPMFDNDGRPLNMKWMDAKYVGDSAFWVQVMEGSGKKVRFRVNGKTRTVKDADGDRKPDPWFLVRNVEGFRSLVAGKTPKRVLGVPEVYSTLQELRSFSAGETKDSPPFITPPVNSVPSLAEMTAGAINVLDENPLGFFLMIEGGAIDWASHDNRKGRMIEEMKSFNEAVSGVINWVRTSSNWDETLVIVTGDHETGLLWGEEPFYPLVDSRKGHLPIMRFHSAGHTNSLIPFFAKGACCDLFRDLADENDPIYGRYIQNSEIALLIHSIWPPEKE